MVRFGRRVSKKSGKVGVLDLAVFPSVMHMWSVLDIKHEKKGVLDLTIFR